MPYKGGFNKLVTRAELLTLIEGLPYVPWVKHVMVHNTYRPTMKQEDDYTATRGELQRLKNFGDYYKGKGWAGPHFFVFNSGMIGLGCPISSTGVGSPGYNHNAWHIEMVADFSIGVDDDDAGKGFVIKDTTCFLVAALLSNQGYDITNKIVLLHKEDPETSHDCPGRDIEKSDVLARVTAYAADLEEVGEHPTTEEDTPFTVYDAWVDVPADDPLNVRSEGGLKGKVVGSLKRAAQVKVVDSAANGSTTWLHLLAPDGWVSSRFLSLKPPPAVVQAYPEPVGKDRAPAAYRYYVEKGLPTYKAAAAVGRFMREAYPTLKDDVWGDYVKDGKPSKSTEPGATGTAWGIMQVRGPRLEHMRRFAAARQQPMDYFYMQLDFFLEEVATSPEVKLAREAWNNATDLEGAVKAMMHYERPRGYVPKAPERGDGYAETIAFAKSLM